MSLIDNLKVPANLLAMLQTMENVVADDARLDYYTRGQCVSFSLNGINRLQSTMLCLENYSFVQQSQRYVKNTRGMFFTPALGMTYLNENPRDLANEYESLLAKTMKLYEDMTEIKEESKGKSRTTIADYKHGIPIEDARYILPLTAKTNIKVAMSASKFLHFLQLIGTYGPLDDIRSDVEEEINYMLGRNGFESNFSIEKCVKPLDGRAGIMKKHMGSNVELEDVIFSDTVYEVALGTLTSSTEIPDIALIENYPKKEDKEKLILRVTGMGHTSILEHASTASKMECSLTCFHQLIRHRLVDIRMCGIGIIQELHHVVPKTIADSIFADDYNALVKEWHEFAYTALCDRNPLVSQLCMLNGDKVQFMYTANVRADMDVMKQRLCMNAQWEIRELFAERKKALLGTDLGFIYKKFALPNCGTIGCQEGNYAHVECKLSGRNKKSCGGNCTCNK